LVFIGLLVWLGFQRFPLGTAFICTILFCITPSWFAAQAATNPSLSQPVVYNYQNYQEETTPEVFQEAKSSGSGKCDYPEQLIPEAIAVEIGRQV
jgi:hypothetical protein